MWIDGVDINENPVKVEVPESIGRAILAAKKNADSVSSFAEGATILILEPNSEDPHSTRIAIAADTTPAAVITIDKSWSSSSPRFTVAIDLDQGKVVGPLAGRFPGLNGHTTNLELRKK